MASFVTKDCHFGLAFLNALRKNILLEGERNLLCLVEDFENFLRGPSAVPSLLRAYEGNSGKVFSFCTSCLCISSCSCSVLSLWLGNPQEILEFFFIHKLLMVYSFPLANVLLLHPKNIPNLLKYSTF